MNTTTPRPTPETDVVVANDTGDNGFLDEIVKTCRRLERERDEAHDQLKAMRDVIADVDKILLSIQRNDIFEETMRRHATCALTKLQPFVKEP